MKFLKIKTRVFFPPKDDLYKLLNESLPPLKEKDVLFITSKILAIHQGRCIKKTSRIKKDDLVRKEAEKYIPRILVPKNYIMLTLKDHTLIPTAGIDESNANGYYVLWPEKPALAAKKIYQYLKQKYRLKELAVIITDSHTIPLRFGVMGISIGFFGLTPLKDYRGLPDIFGRKLKITRSNIADSLAAMAVLLMGEGNEQIPLVILRGAKFIKFTNREAFSKLVIPEKEDLYYPLLKVFRKSPKRKN